MSKNVLQFGMVTTLSLSLWWVGVARGGDVLLVGFDDSAAVAANGPIPGTNGVPEVTAADICGASDKSYLAELIDTAPADVKVIEHWADIVDGKEMMVSGVVHGVSLGGIDLPFDHPFSGDMNFDLELDPPYQAFAKNLGTGADPDGGEAQWLHVELEVGQLPHDPALVVHGPASGEPWDILATAPPQTTLNGTAGTGLRSEFIPQEGDRIAIMGRWIIDCGHTSFHAELHPLTFMAFGHAVGEKTVVHVVANPYRSTQRYTTAPGGVGANKVNDRTRTGNPFPSFLAQEVFSFVLQSRDHLEAPVFLEATRPNPVKWKVCTPPGTSGRALHIMSSFIKRPHTHVRVQPARDEAGVYRCVDVTSRVGSRYVAKEPALRQCELPWDWLNTQAADQAGLVSDFDMRPLIKDAIDQAASGAISQAQIDAAKARVDNPVTSACFDPLAGPLPASPPVPAPRRWRLAVNRADQPFPFYGTIELSWGN